MLPRIALAAALAAVALTGASLSPMAAAKGLHHRVVKRRLTHYSLTRFFDDVLGVPYLREAKKAR